MRVCLQKRDFCPCLRPPKVAARLGALSYEPSSKTELFSVTDACIGCGLCARKCPVQAIEMQGKGRQARPEWTKANCAVCLGCAHRCPKHAIDYGKGGRPLVHEGTGSSRTRTRGCSLGGRASWPVEHLPAWDGPLDSAELSVRSTC